MKLQFDANQTFQFDAVEEHLRIWHSALRRQSDKCGARRGSAQRQGSPCAFSADPESLGLPQVLLDLPHESQGLPHESQGLPHVSLELPHVSLELPQVSLGLPHVSQGLPHVSLGLPHESPDYP